MRITSKLTRPSSIRKWLNCQLGLKMDVRVQPSPREDGVGSSREYGRRRVVTGPRVPWTGRLAGVAVQYVLVMFWGVSSSLQTRERCLLNVAVIWRLLEWGC